MEFLTKTAIDAAVAAGSYLLSQYKCHHVNFYDADTLSVARRGYSKEITSALDHEADRIVIKTISENYPGHNILTEETGLIDRGSPFTWVVDPLDGSSNYVNHNPFFAVSICLVHNNEPMTGVIFSPFLEEMVVARKGHGCTVNGRAVKVSSTESFKRSYMVGCPGGDPDGSRYAKMSYVLSNEIKDFRKMGSAAIEAYMVASGRVDGFVTLNISPWDIAAGALCVQEAGGRVTDFEGRPWNLEKSDVCMSNGVLHDVILDRVGGGALKRSNAA